MSSLPSICQNLLIVELSQNFVNCIRIAPHHHKFQGLALTKDSTPSTIMIYLLRDHNTSIIVPAHKPKYLSLIYAQHILR